MIPEGAAERDASSVTGLTAPHFRASLRDARALFLRPQPVTLPMIALFAIIPVYLVIGSYVSDGVTHRPQFAWDDWFPLTPAWSVVYLSLFLAAFLPVFVVHQQELIRRVVLAYLSVWLGAYAIFLLYPTAAPLHEEVVGQGFGAAVLRATYDADVPYNCFPSLHVAQCFLAAFACNKVHRGVGLAAFVWASLVGLSTLYTKQHYVVDVLGGMVLAAMAYAVFMRDHPLEATPEAERRLAPLLALGAVTVYALIVIGFWVLYAVNFLV